MEEHALISFDMIELVLQIRMPPSQTFQDIIQTHKSSIRQNHEPCQNKRLENLTCKSTLYKYAVTIIIKILLFK